MAIIEKNFVQNRSSRFREYYYVTSSLEILDLQDITMHMYIVGVRRGTVFVPFLKFFFKNPQLPPLIM